MADGFTDALEVARLEAARMDLPREDPYLELMATYVELGELLSADRWDAEKVEEFQALVDQLVAVSRDQKDYDDQQFAVWRSHITTNDGEVEGGQ